MCGKLKNFAAPASFQFLLLFQFSREEHDYRSISSWFRSHPLYDKMKVWDSSSGCSALVYVGADVPHATSSAEKVFLDGWAPFRKVLLEAATLISRPDRTSKLESQPLPG